MPPFPPAEYETRIQNTQARMERDGIDVLVVTDPANMYYLSGYDAWSFYVPQALVLSLEASQPIWIGREMDAAAAEQTTWLDAENIHYYTDDYVQSPDDKHPMDVIADVLRDRTTATGTIGTEMDAPYFTARSYQRLTNRLPDAEFVDATLLVNWERLVKSDREIQYMRQATTLVEHAMDAALDVIEPGVRECDVIAEIYRAGIGGTDAFGGEYPAIVPLMPTGKGTNTPHLTWTDDRIEPQTPIILELAGCKHRYHSPMARSVYVGDPPERLQRVATAITDGVAAAFETVEAGVTCATVEQAWRETIADHGFEKESRIGYGVGIGYPPDWGEHNASLRPSDETILRENMTFHLIPGIWLDDVGLELSQTIRVTSSGVEVFGEYPRELFVL
ncbi:MAG: M24 family metallopeptidase [Halobacteriales archaeon]